jgi:hypothetical protein
VFLSQLGFRGNEVSRLEEKLDLEGIKVHLDAGKGRRVTGKSLAEFTKRVFGEYKKLMKNRNKETVSKKITKFLNTPISFKTEGQSPETEGQIQLFSDGLNYDEARQIPFTKGGKKLDLVEPLRKLIRIGIERNFVPVEGASHDELEEGEAELPGPTATFVLEKRRARKEFTAKARETATMKVAELRKKKRDEEMEKAVAKQKKKDDAERRKKDAAQKKAKRSKPKKQLGSSSQKQK